ncbi:hypothetical protein [Brucella intermedia]|uniref:hypothetical protein n=1 Tax=Brucella intermedia TaxID=94625 RepID=UPI0021C84EAB|nr:hypothetical protein [Brucella intermedia]UXO85401.1 hypothetical protein N8I72_13550 [Brucella intermedia]WGJ08054.1 hypothetical protein QBQ48_17540 [Brucella intermedia]
MDLLLREQMASMPDLRHRLRQLRWFRATFRKHASLLHELYGVEYDIDEKKLTEAFLNWVELVDQNKRFAKVDRKDFITFAAGLVLRELIRLSPAKVTSPPIQADGDAGRLYEIVRFWPEGFLYTNYCICAIAAVQEQEFGTVPNIDQCADELRTWWSYKENIAEMPGYAIAFLDKFLGGEPNWVMPDLASARAAVKRALADKPVTKIQNK